MNAENEESVAKLKVSVPIDEESPDFDEWQERQDFEYSRIESEVVDFINSVVKHESLTLLLEAGVEEIIDEMGSVEEITVTIDNLDAIFESVGIPLNSEKSAAAKTHLAGYATARTTYYHRLLE